MSKKNRKRQQAPNAPGGHPVPTAPFLVDVVMPVFGEWAMAEKSLASVGPAMAGIAEGYTVTVVDNGTPPWADDKGGRIEPAEQAIGVKSLLRQQDKLLRIEQNIGYPGGCNYGISKTRSPLILVWTADVVMDPGSIAHLVRDLDDPSVAVVGPLLTFPNDTKYGPAGKVQSAGMAFNIKGEPFHIFIGWSPDNPRVAQRREMAAVTGALLLIRRSAFIEAEGFNLAYGAGTFEDMDLCFSIRSKGHKVIFNPAAHGTHHVAGSIAQGAMANQSFNLPVNGTIFRGRFATMLAWDEWKFW